MFIFIIILLTIFILGYIYLGVYLSNVIKDANHQILFWILYVITALTIFLIVISILFFAKYRKKVGPIGPRGFMGERGEEGDKGTCGDVKNGCQRKTFMLLIEKRFINEFESELNSEDRKTIYDFVYSKDLDFTNTKYSDLKKFDNQLLLNISGNKNISIKQVLEMMPKLEEYNIIIEN